MAMCCSGGRLRGADRAGPGPGQSARVRVLRRASVWASVGKCLEASLTGEVNRDVW